MDLTSNNWSIRKLGGKIGKRLHRLIDLAQILFFGHILLIEKADLQFYGTWLLLLVALQVARFSVVFYRFKVRRTLPA